MTDNNQKTTAGQSLQTNSAQEYNSTRPPLRLPEYGRLVQGMVEHALTIEDKDERQVYVEAIAQVMAGLNPKMKDVPDYQHKIWDHIAYMSGYRLEVDYPFMINQHVGEHVRPERIAYPRGTIRFRHYGRLIEKAMDRLESLEPGEEREALLVSVANRMKRNLADWKGDGVDDEKVARDIGRYTEQRINPDFNGPGRGLMQINENRFRTRKNKGTF